MQQGWETDACINGGEGYRSQRARCDWKAGDQLSVGPSTSIAISSPTSWTPLQMYIRYRKPGPTARYALEALNVLCFLVTVCAIAGSVQLIVADSADYEVFGS